MKRGFVDSPDGQIHYRIGGDGPALIVLHHTPGSSLQLEPFLEALAKRVKAIGMDTMGYGESDRPAKPFTTTGEFARTVVALADGLGLEKFHLMGALTGSQIALQVAADYPDRVETLILQEPFNWNTPARRAVHERLHKYSVRKEDGSHLLELWQRTGFRTETDLREREKRFKDLLRVNDDEGAEVYGSMGWEGAGPNAMCNQDAWEAAARVKAPTLITYFANSELQRAMDKFLETIPQSKGMKDVPSFMRGADELAQIVTDFMTSPGI